MPVGVLPPPQALRARKAAIETDVQDKAFIEFFRLALLWRQFRRVRTEAQGWS